METGSRGRRETDRRRRLVLGPETDRENEDRHGTLREARWPPSAEPGAVPIGFLGRIAIGQDEPIARLPARSTDRDPNDLSATASPASPTLESVSRALEAFGLRRSTSRLYCAALRAGPALPREIIRSARVSRATGYRGLERLRRTELLLPARDGTPQMEALPLPRFLDRSANALLDEANLHREMREVAADALARDDPMRNSPTSGLIGPGDVGTALRDSLAVARREVLLIPLLRMLPPDSRSVLQGSLQHALHRGVRVRMLIPHQSTYVRMFAGLSPLARADPQLLARVSEPAFFHLYVVDSTRALRFFVRSTVSDHPSRLLGIVSERRPFVQAQEQRFRMLWSESPDLVRGT